MKIIPDRTIFDTNVLISAFFFPESLPAQCLRIAQRQNVLLASEETLGELSKVLLRSKFDKYLALEARLEVLLAFCQTLEIVRINNTLKACRDPRDDKFLSLAISGKADLIVTGDSDLLELNPFHGVIILAPSNYVEH